MRQRQIDAIVFFIVRPFHSAAMSARIAGGLRKVVQSHGIPDYAVISGSRAHAIRVPKNSLQHLALSCTSAFSVHKGTGRRGKRIGGGGSRKKAETCKI